MIGQAFDYLTRQTAHWDTPHLQAVVRSSAAHALAQQIDAAALAGDVRATQAACRAYWTHVLGHAPSAEEGSV
jgi:hypothetical protein